jgi:hypothetical protein
MTHTWRGWWQVTDEGLRSTSTLRDSRWNDTPTGQGGLAALVPYQRRGAWRPVMGPLASSEWTPSSGPAHDERGSMRRPVTVARQKSSKCHGGGGLPEGIAGNEGPYKRSLASFL